MAGMPGLVNLGPSPRLWILTVQPLGWPSPAPCRLGCRESQLRTSQTKNCSARVHEIRGVTSCSESGRPEFGKFGYCLFAVRCKDTSRRQSRVTVNHSTGTAISTVVCSLPFLFTFRPCSGIVMTSSAGENLSRATQHIVNTRVTGSKRYSPRVAPGFYTGSISNEGSSRLR